MPKELPLYLEVDGYYHAGQMSRPWADVIAEGVVQVEANALKASASQPASLGVQVAPGSCWVYRDGAGWLDRGCWQVTVDAIVQLAIDPNTGGNPRIDVVVVEVLDQMLTPGANDWQMRVVKGVVGSNPAPPATPPNAIAVAQVRVVPAASAINAGDITDVRAKARLGGRLQPAAAAIPGEIKLWPGAALPDPASFGRWAWADGAVYDVATYPLAAANIAPAWKTAHGQADPGAGKFRAPDLRGLAPVGLDAMPGGARANRLTRAVAITIAAKTGEELHVITLAETAPHGHGINDPGHAHSIADPGHYHWVDAFFHSYGGGGLQTQDFASNPNVANVAQAKPVGTGIGIYAAYTGVSVAQAGGGGGHENLQPSVMVPYMVKLDD